MGESMNIPVNEHGIHEYDFTHYRGDTFEEFIQIENMDISNTIFKMTIRSTNGDEIFPIIEKSFDGIRIIIPHEMTKNSLWKNAVYDIQTELDNIVKTILKGRFTLIGDVTK